MSALMNDEQEFANEPMKKFETWFELVKQQSTSQEQQTLWPEFAPTAMTLATSSRDGRPSARTVLMKGYDGEGITFCSNYSSRKGSEIDENPNVALLFYWTRPVTRQVRVEGIVKKVSSEESSEMFHSRPRSSQVASAISKQSEPVDSRETIDRLFTEGLSHYESTKDEVPRPENWGGYRVHPLVIEFWQEGDHRLADRIVYKRDSITDDRWNITRLYP